MPTKSHQQIYTDAELSNLVAKLNLFYTDFSPWRPTSARKHHQDLFGEEICEGETYYERHAGAAFHDVIKLSALSMGRLVYCLTYCNYRFDDLAQRLSEIAHEHNQAQAKKINFRDAASDQKT